MFHRIGELRQRSGLTSESVEGAFLALERVDDIHGRNRLPTSVLGVCNSVTDDVLQKYLENSAGLLVDQTGDALDTTSASVAPMPRHAPGGCCKSFGLFLGS